MDLVSKMKLMIMGQNLFHFYICLSSLPYVFRDGKSTQDSFGWKNPWSDASQKSIAWCFYNFTAFLYNFQLLWAFAFKINVSSPFSRVI